MPVKLARRVVQSKDLVAYEDLMVRNMVKNRKLSKSISDAAWSAFRDWLELKPSKTRLAHTLNRYELEEPGFNFLGFNIKQYPVGKYQSGTNGCKKPLGFKTFIKPSKEKLKIHTQRVGSIIKAHMTAPQEALIDHLNPVIKGWANYYSTVVSKETYKKVDMLTYQQLRAWANYRHPNKTPGWVAKKYWQTLGNDNWSFASRKKGKVMRLKKHSETAIVRHVS